MRESHLYALLAAENAVSDPSVLEAEGRAFLIRGKVDRVDPHAKWQYIKATYGCMTNRMVSFQMDAGFTVTPKELLPLDEQPGTDSA